MKVIRFTLLCLLVSTMVYGQDKTIGISTLTDAPIQGTNAKRYVLIVGNAQYRGSIPTLPVCINDADSITTVMVRFGFSPTVAKNQEYFELRNTILTFMAGLPPDSEVIIYWSGHGLHFGQRDYLIPVDYVSICNDPDIEKKAISLQWILQQLAPRKVSSAAIYLDACRSMIEGCETECFGSSFNDAQLPDNVAVYMSSSNCKKSYFPPNLVNSFFTSGLLHALKILQLSSSVVFEKAYEFTRKEAAKYNVEQSPIAFSKSGGMVINNLPIKTNETFNSLDYSKNTATKYRDVGSYEMDDNDVSSARVWATDDAIANVGSKASRVCQSFSSSIRNKNSATSTNQKIDTIERTCTSSFEIMDYDITFDKQIGKTYFIAIEVSKENIISIFSDLINRTSNFSKSEKSSIIKDFKSHVSKN